MRNQGCRIHDEVIARESIRKRQRLRTPHAKGRTMPDGNRGEGRHLLKQEGLLELEVQDVQHGHITRASDKDGVWQSQSEGRLPMVLQRSMHNE